MTDLPPPPPPPSQPYAPPPGGYAAGYGYGYPAGPAARPRSLGGLATALTVLFVIGAVASLALAGARLSRASLLDDPASISFDEATAADDRVAAASSVYGLCCIALAVLWIIWQFRHAKNAELLGQRDGLGAGWAIGGWFIPIGNFFLPVMQLRHSAKASDPDAPPGRGRVPAVVSIWWATWLVQLAIGLASGSYAVGVGTNNRQAFDTTPTDLRRIDRMNGVALLINVVAAILAILVVRTLTERQQRALRRGGATTPRGPESIQPG
jgi:hypothetical protein